MSEFKWRQFEGEIILWAVRWYCRYGISYRDLEQMMGERGVAVDHSTIYRWVQKYAPEMEKRLRWHWRRPQSTSWRVDETYVKVRGEWAYLYRALDKHENAIDFYLSPTRNANAAKRFLGKALNGLKKWERPEVINTDKAPTYGIAISELKAEGKCPPDTVHRQVKYLNNIVEADHGKLKQLIRPVRGFKTMKTAYATIKGFEVIRALRKGQAAIFNLTGNVRGEARIVERAFGIGTSMLAEAVELIEEQHLFDVPQGKALADLGQARNVATEPLLAYKWLPFAPPPWSLFTPPLTDCLRHYEIAANGCVMCFRDLTWKPATCAPHGLSQDNCVIYRNYDDLQRQIGNMSDAHYEQLQAATLKWANENTTIESAKRLLCAINPEFMQGEVK